MDVVDLFTRECVAEKYKVLYEVVKQHLPLISERIAASNMTLNHFQLRPDHKLEIVEKAGDCQREAYRLLDHKFTENHKELQVLSQLRLAAIEACVRENYAIALQACRVLYQDIQKRRFETDGHFLKCEQNANGAYIAQLEQLYEKWQSRLEMNRQRSLASEHAAFRRLADSIEAMCEGSFLPNEYRDARFHSRYIRMRREGSDWRKKQVVSFARHRMSHAHF
jgi:hypothetical protein